MFQSTPAHSSGRYQFRYGHCGRLCLFQSTPAHSSGRYTDTIHAPFTAWGFQSTPAHSSGRYSRVRTAPSPTASFNPRPLIRAGDTSPQRPSASGSPLFQSTPAHSSGRYGRSPDDFAVRIWFQSTPAHSSGRYVRCRFPPAPPTGFNPRPLIRAGDTPQASRGLSRQMVSIHARSFERAIPGDNAGLPGKEVFQSTPAHSSGRYAGCAALPAARDCFNPRPLIRAGDTIPQRCLYFPIKPVSIHARSFERAIHQADLQELKRDKFQSTPAHSSGRYQAHRFPRHADHRFNPRPLIRAGDTKDLALRARHLGVSIHARSFERAIPASPKTTTMPMAVSIHARSFERAIPKRQQCLRSKISVSIHARSFERAIPQQRPQRPCHQLFQSTPAHSSGRYQIRPDQPVTPSVVSIHARSFERAIRERVSV